MNYLDRMMTARNPRVRQLAEKIMAKRDRVTVSPEAETEHLRNKYRRLTGNTPDRRWSSATLLAKVLAAQDVAPCISDTREEIGAALNSLESKS